jgi:hypothetical protein
VAKTIRTMVAWHSFIISQSKIYLINIFPANRLEEREADQKVEYEKLHERYNDLLRTHIDHVERTKFLMGAENFDMATLLPAAKRLIYFIYLFRRMSYNEIIKVNYFKNIY